jgi:hypothetical protein
MNEHKKPRGHKAHNDKDSILADSKNLLFILHPSVQRMPKIERIEGAPVEMKRALQGIIRHFSIAKEYQDARRQCVVSKPEYNFRARLNDKYHLKLKRL